MLKNLRPHHNSTSVLLFSSTVNQPKSSRRDHSLSAVHIHSLCQSLSLGRTSTPSRVATAPSDPISSASPRDSPPRRLTDPVTASFFEIDSPFETLITNLRRSALPRTYGMKAYRVDSFNHVSSNLNLKRLFESRLRYLQDHRHHLDILAQGRGIISAYTTRNCYRIRH